MTAPSPTYFYNQQIATYILQFIRIFGNFQIKTGVGANGAEKYITVPVRYADMSRQAATVLQQNSQNMLLSCPFMTCQVTGLSMSSDRRQLPNHISTIHVDERYFDSDTQQYTTQEGQQYTIDRYMPVPYELTMELAIWTSNTDQKLQLLEQICVIFNPSLDLQTSVNPLDWSSLTYVELDDAIVWTERAVPAGTEDTMDTAKMTFKMPIYINPPAKLKRQHLINTIISNIFQSPSEEIPVWNGNDQLIARQFLTIKDHRIRIQGNIITLLGSDGGEENEKGKPYDWSRLLALYGHYNEGFSQIQLKTTTDMADFQTNIVGTIKLLNGTPNKLIWTYDPDTLPKNTLADINAIIDPQEAFPGNVLPLAQTGQRYLIIDHIGPCKAWGNLYAQADDIIEFDGTEWQVVFKPTNTIEYLTNANPKNLKQYKWTGEQWTEVIDGEYYPGFWWITL